MNPDSGNVIPAMRCREYGVNAEVPLPACSSS